MGLNDVKFSILFSFSRTYITYFKLDYFTFNTLLLLAVLISNILIGTQAQAFENNNPTLSLKQLLLMPGDLTTPHAKIENKCQECHLHFDKENQSPLCLNCHEEIDNDLKQKQGFHSSITKAEIKQCNGCHTDHQGRDFDITSLDKIHFNHNKTEFPLKNSHQSLICSDCHKPTDDNFRLPLKSGQCISCHDDPHQGKLKNDCSQCHDETQWQRTQFDHNETNFLLEGKHENISCQSCHVNDVAAEIGTQCVTCHLSNDKHLNTFGHKCQSCHSSKGWQKTQYDHFKETKFRLLGKHKSLSCENCHAIIGLSSEQKQGNKLAKTCNGCHKQDDVHLGSNGSDCQQCHNNNDWGKVNFNHDKKTTFSLQGAHKDLVCEACHLPQSFKKTPEKTQIEKQLTTARTCHDCHQITDVHKGKLGQDCQNCHQQEKWHEQVTFNHDFTSFPLTGAHQLQVCQTCHFSSDFTMEQFDCIDCHQEDDPHQNSLGKKCQQCHNSASWDSWQFNHQKQTDYLLEGSHKNLTCGLCHNALLEKPLSPPSQCVACHQSDDIHHGAFGKNCQQCHNMDSFYDFKH